MFSGGISDLEKFRLELEQHIETAKSLINHASAQGRDAPADPHGAVSAMSSAIFTIASATQEAIAATEFATLRIEASPLRPELADLIERLHEIDEALRVVVAAMSASGFTGSTRRKSRSDARRMDISSPTASMHRRRSASRSAESPSAAFAAILTAIVVWWRCVQSKASKSAGGWSSKDRRSPSERAHRLRRR
jgi:hypothetical protein